MRSLVSSGAGRLAVGIVVAVALVTAIGLVVLWPSGPETEAGAGLAGSTERAEVVGVSSAPCPQNATLTCSQAEVVLETGPDAGQTATIDLIAGGVEPDVAVGDQVRVVGADAGPGTETFYSLVDFERRQPMIFLALGFIALVVIFGRLRGALSLVGLLASLAVILAFIVPAIRDGEAPLAVALVGALAVMLLTISLAHGLGSKSIAAMLGTAGSLVLVVLLAAAFTELTQLTGFATEEASFLATGNPDLSFRGLLLAGMVIGALGVLDDVTVSQSSTVMALRAAN
ncbi:MAG: YibE/F family protein, partial [Solirubrobacterales bacterium]